MFKRSIIMTCIIAFMVTLFGITTDTSNASVKHPLTDDLNLIEDEYFSDVLFYGSSFRYNFIAKAEDGYWRIKIDSNGILVRKCDESFKTISNKKIKKELKYVAGFYEGEEHFYVFFSDTNTKEDNNKEVFRVVKYSKNWERLGAVSIYGQNAGSICDYGLDAVEYGEYLFIHTDHTMYTSEDGMNHEANIVFKIKTSDMSFVESTAGSFTCSHSFDQYITVDDQGNIILLNKGDYTGAELIATFEKTATEDNIFEDPYFGVFQDAVIENPYDGGDGVWGFENYVKLGGLEYSADNYITAGSSLTLDDNWDNNKVTNVYISLTPRSDVTKEEVYTDEGDGWGSISRPFSRNNKTTLKWLTSYKEGSKTSCGKPYLVKISDDRFLVMWSQVKTWKEDTSSNSTGVFNLVYDCDDFVETGKVSYVLIDGQGNIIQPEKTVSAYLSDCTPIVDGTNVTWYYTPYGGPTVLCKLDPAAGTVKKSKSDSKISIKKATIEDIFKSTYLGKKVKQEPDVYIGKWSSWDDDNYTRLKEGKDYTVSYKNNNKVGKATITFKGIGDFTGTVSRTFKIIPEWPEIKSVKPSKKSFTVKWEKVRKQTTGYQIQYSLKKNFKKAKTITIKKNTVTSKKIKKLKKNKKYYVRVRTYKNVKGKKYYSYWSSKKSVKTK